MLERWGRGCQQAYCLVRAGPVIPGIDHAAQHGGVEPARDVEITAQMLWLDASGAEFQPHAAAAGVTAEAVEIIELVGLQQGVVADLEHTDAQVSCPVDHLGQRERVLGGVVPLPEEGICAQADGHGTTPRRYPANASALSGLPRRTPTMIVMIDGPSGPDR